jgi:Flp pilus assembly protein TadD
VLASRPGRLDENSAKLVLRKGRALTMKGDFEEAEAVLQLAREMEGGEALAEEVDAALLNNRQREKLAAKKQKQQFKNFFDRS